MPFQTRSTIQRADLLDCADTLAHMSEIALANTNSTSSVLNHIQYAHGSHISSGAFPRPEGPIENLEGIYRRIQSQQDLRYFPESKCREEGSRTPPDSSSAAATVFTSGPSSSGSSGLVSSPPPAGQSRGNDHPSGVADEDSHDSQATESAPEDETSGQGEVKEENRKPCCICPRCPRHSKSWVCQECGDSPALDEFDAPCCCPGPDAESCGSDCEETEVQGHVRSKSPEWESVL